MRNFAALTLLAVLCACAQAHNHDPGYTYQSRQDAYFDGCKSGNECSHPVDEPMPKQILVKPDVPRTTPEAIIYDSSGKILDTVEEGEAR